MGVYFLLEGKLGTVLPAELVTALASLSRGQEEEPPAGKPTQVNPLTTRPSDRY